MLESLFFCYRFLQLQNPDRLRDWISTSKSNGYESLHTTVMGPDGKWVEVQIRTRRMDDIEKGYMLIGNIKIEILKNLHLIIG